MYILVIPSGSPNNGKRVVPIMVVGLVVVPSSKTNVGLIHSEVNPGILKRLHGSASMCSCYAPKQISSWEKGYTKRIHVKCHSQSRVYNIHIDLENHTDLRKQDTNEKSRI